MSIEYIVSIIMISLFIVGAIIFTVSLIFFVKNAGKTKSNKQKVKFGFSILGTIIGLCFIAIPIRLILSIRSSSHEAYYENIDTGITISWETDEDAGGRYFILNDRKYIYFRIENSQISQSVEIDRAIANIMPEDYQKMKWFYSLIGATNSMKRTIYSLKNCNDYSILTTDRFPSASLPLYCDIEYLEDKYKYYNNLVNYTFYFSLDSIGNEKFCKPIQYTKINIIDYLYNYKGTETDIDEKKYDYISIFGISNDKIIHKYIMTVIKDGDNYYRKEDSTYDKFHVTIIDGVLKSLLLELIE